jgi:uncharacterized protein YjdB
MRSSLKNISSRGRVWDKAILLFLMLISVSGAFAQTRETGHELVRGELNFTEKAEYLRLHPEPIVIKWKDTARKGRIPLHLDLVDPTLIRSRSGGLSPFIVPPSSAPAPMMPVSPSPDTAFQSTLDNGTTIPPDTHGAVDSNYCVTTVNSAVRIQSRSGTSVSQVSLDAFWSPVLSGGGSFDPRVHYDPYTNRWIIVAVSGARAATSSILLAVSKTSNPTGDWWQYKITAYSAGDYWLDFPNVGFNNKWITISGVLFQNSGTGYNGCKTFIFNKANVLSGAGAPFTAITQASSGNICPAITYSNTLGSMFMVEAWNGGAKLMRMWKITGAVGSESMSSVGFPAADYPWWYQPFPVSGTSFGDNAPQLGSANKINNGDNRVTQLIYMNNKLWFSHTIFLPYNAAANPTRSAVQWWQTDTAGVPVQVGRVDDSAAGKFFAYSTIAVNTNNDALIGYSVFSSTMRPSAGYSLRMNSDPTDSVRTPVIYRDGQNSYYKTYGGSKNRWGDYSATVLDPLNNTNFWTIQEVSAPTINVWDTWWANVVPPVSCSTPAISGTLSSCAGAGTTLTSTTSGGTWTSSNTSIATVVSGTGVVTAIASGTTTISYSVTGGCVGTAVYTVNAIPSTITGTASVCAGATTSLSSATSGGTWASSATGIATVGSTGIVSGVAAGTVTISYTVSGCVRTVVVTVNALPASITGTASVCAGATTSLTSATSGGTWASSATGIATVGSTGIVSGVAAGTATISYTVSGCVRTVVVTVNALPATITGTASVCAGATTSLSSATSGGTWASSATGIATVGSTGIVSGVAAGTTTISYTVSGCVRTVVVTVNAIPSTITGTATVCAGATTSLTSATSGGTWASSATGIATVGSTGIVSGIAAGTATISYTVSGCVRTVVVTVNAIPAIITGTATVCAGATTSLTSATSGGTWASSATGIATVGSTGIVSGVAAGTATISYTVSGCVRTVVVTVNPLPNAGSITGPSTVVVGASITLSDAVSGGAWSTSSSTIAAVGSTGVVTGMAVGSATISYSVSNGCGTAVATKAITVTATAPSCDAVITTYAGTGVSGYNGDGIAATSAQLYHDGIAADAAGNLYVADYNNQRIRKITPDGTITTICGNGTGTSTGDGGPATAATVNQPLDVLLDASGNIYISEYFGNRIRKINTSGIISTVAGTGSATFGGDGGPATAAQLNRPSGMGMDAAGNLYFADFDNNRVRKINTSGVISTIAGTGTSGYSGDGGAGTSANLALPFRVAVDGPGNVYIADFLNSRVRKVNTSGVITTVAGTGTNGFSGDGGPATAANITYAFGVSLDASNNLYISDYNNNRIRKVDGSGIITTVAGTGTGGFSGDGGPATAAKLSNPVDVTFDGSGNMYIADRSNSRIRKIGLATTPITGTFSVCPGNTTSLSNATSGGTWSSSTTGVATVGSTGIVTGIAAGTSNITYVSTCFSVAATVTVNSIPSAGTITGSSTVDVGATITLSDAVSGGTWSTSSSTIAAVGSTGVVTGMAVGSATISYSVSNGCGTAVATKAITVTAPAPTCDAVITTYAGTGVSGYNGDGIAATSAQLYHDGIAADAAGNLYVADYNNQRIRKITPDGTITTICGNGTGTSTGDGGPATAATVNQPLDVLLDASGNIYISEYFGNRIRKINTSGIISTVAGTGSATFGGDGGPATAAQLNRPSGMGMDAAGNLYFADFDNNRVRKINTSGVISTIAGTGTSGYSGDGGAGTSANLALPFRVAVDGPGNVYIADFLNSRVRKVNTSGVITTVAGTGTNGFSGDGGPATAANITYAFGVSLDASNNLYISDYNNNRIRKVDGSGIITTVAGTGTGGFSGDGGPATAAKLSNPVDVTFDGSGNMYIADRSNSRIRKIGLATTPITGTFSVCPGNTTSLSNATSGGTWSSSTTGVATVGSTGVVTGIAAGTSNITYVSACFSVAATVTVNPLPDAGTITGLTTVDEDSSIALSVSVSGGTWSSSNTAVATVGSTGIVNGIAAGSATISYSVSNACGTAVATINITVQAIVASPITGVLATCVGATTTLSNAATGGTWSSSTPSVATVGAATGIVSGVSVGTATISYTLGSAFVTVVVSVYSVPAAITGTATVCAGANTTLASTSTGGIWSSGNTAIATVDGTTGIVTGIVAGTSVISYTISGSCSSTKVVTVNAAPAAISGSLNSCIGITNTLTCSPAGGAWSSSTPAVANINSSGQVTGFSTGTTTISYSFATGCRSTAILTVNILPDSVSGTAVVCAGLTTIFTGYPGGGSWSSSNTSVATVDASGVISGLALGTSRITYTNAGGCYKTKIVTVNAAPFAITGTANVCVANTTTLASAGGGTWSSSDVAVGTIGITTGVVGGISSGTAIITYRLSTGCINTRIITVNAAPSSITGTANICVGTTTTLSSTPTGGSWSSSGLSVGTVGVTSGVVTAISGGAVTISYTISGGCRVTRIVTVNNNPPSIGGTATLATGGTTTLTNGLTGGSWSSGATGIATVGSTGIVFGVGAGTAVISYTSAAGCSVTRIVTVSGAIGGITGVTTLCTGATTALSCSPAGGTWNSANTAVATVSSTGIVTGISAGTAMISYNLSGTSATTVVSVYAMPAAISGSAVACIGTNIVLSNSVTGGTWSSSNNAVATIGSTGIVTPVAAGVTIISYQMSAGCGVTKSITVNTIPAAITGTTIVCVGTAATLTSSTTGGAWSSSDPSVANIDGSGTYTGASAGTATITYTTGSGCFTTIDITVNSVPGSISGTLSACVGNNSTLSTASTGGTWSSSNTSVATVDASGIVTAIAAGTTIIAYNAGSGCAVTAMFTVNPTPSAIGGTLAICIGNTTTLTNATSGGTWASGDLAVGTIDAAYGSFAGLTSGTSAVTYTATSGCSIVAEVTVNALPGTISGTASVCASGGSTTLSCTPGGGVWSTTTPSIATIGTASGVVSGVIAGTAIVTYSVGSGCFSTIVVTVNAVPATISGVGSVCPGTTTTFSSATTGGSWSSSNVGTATVSASGVVTGVAAGVATISYQLSGCVAVKSVTVNALPGVISGASVLCSGITTTLSATPSGGTWSSSNTAVGTIGITTGVFTGLTGGNTTVTYKLATGCQSETTLTINATPAAISGPVTLCLGSTISLSSATSGGTWSSSNAAVASVNTSGVVSGNVNGVATISYTVGSCSALKTVTVNTAFTSGSTYNMCIGSTKTLVDSLPGGTWSSSNTSVATVVTGTGFASAISVGVTTITYFFGTGCSKTTPLYVQNSNAVIAGPSTLCEGSATTMSVPSAAIGGTWTSSNSSVATINMSTGALNAVTTGVVTVSYTLVDCITTKVVTINPRPAAITGTQFACVGLSTSLSDATAGGSWISSATAIATVGTGTGIVTGVVAGTSNISYVLPTGCLRTAIVTVAATPAAITGTANVCVGNTTTLASVTTGGTWSSSNAAVASVAGSAGVVSGVAAGNATITYGFGGTCVSTKAVTVNATPGAIAGPDDVCAGQTITLTNALAPGTWSSSAAGVATANASTGLITGAAAGTVTITYRTTAGGCTATKVITVNAAMPAITGGNSVCVGNVVTLSTTATGGTWISSVTAKATVGSTTGIVNGIATGSSTITYMVSTGCYKTALMLVNPAPAAITGASAVVVGSSTTLSCATTGGAWSSSNTAIGTVGSASGAVTGVTAGTITISYTVITTGCRSLKAMTVNPTPLARDAAAGDKTGGISFSVFPNPSQGMLTVQSSVSGTFRIYTLDSKLISEYLIDAPSANLRLPSELATGIYMCKFNREDGTVETVRLVYRLQ